MAAHRRQLLLAIAKSDTSFEEVIVSGSKALRGKCIHCRSALLLSSNGETLGEVTIEHILPRCHGGTDDLENLALACRRCNSSKGVKKDSLPKNDPSLIALVDALRTERMRRWREPPERAVQTLPPMRASKKRR